MSAVPSAKPAFDVLDMRNYALEKLPELPAGIWAKRLKLVGLPIAILVFLYFHLQWCGPIGMYDAQTKIKPATLLYSATGLFLASLILWITEALPNYLTSLIVIVATVLVGLMKYQDAFAQLGQPVMILNIASFIMASALVVTGLAKRLSLFLVLKTGLSLDKMFWAFIVINMILGAFISATSAKTALTLPIFMVIAASFGATGGDKRNGVGRNMVLQNLLYNNVSASAFLTGSAANLLAAQQLEKAGAAVPYASWMMALLPLALIQCAIGWFSGTRWLLPIKPEDKTPKLEGGIQRLKDEYAKLGRISNAEIRAGIVFLVVLALWATDTIHGIRAEVVAVAGACAVLLPSVMGLPRFGVVKWDDADIPWHMMMFSWGAYVLGAFVDSTNIVGLTMDSLFKTWGITAATPKVLVFFVMALIFGLTTLVSESKTARTVIMFPILIATAKSFGWDILGFCLPMAFMINQVYVLYYNSKPANISYLTNQYSMWESFKFGIVQLLVITVLLVFWAQYAMPLMGFKSQLW